MINYKLVQHNDFNTKKASTNPTNKIDKKLDKHNKTSCIYQKEVCRNPGSQQEENL